jgi:hypothetical protein
MVSISSDRKFSPDSQACCGAEVAATLGVVCGKDPPSVSVECLPQSRQGLCLTAYIPSSRITLELVSFEQPSYLKYVNFTEVNHSILVKLKRFIFIVPLWQ